MTTARANALRMAALKPAPDYEATLEQKYRRLISPGDLVIDIGAHSGRHTSVFSELVGPTGRVWAFEPLPEVRNAIVPRDCLRIYPFALSDRAGTATFTRVEGALEESGLRQKIYNRPDLVTKLDKFEVEVRALDDFAGELDGLSFIKIDVEGNEIAVLNGARKALAENRPFLSVEYGYPSYSAYGHSRQTLFKAAESMQYRIGDFFGSIVSDLDEWEHTCDVSYWDWFLVPVERSEEWSRRISQEPQL
ncbi:FkbM family methyltransferase [Bradyrhizobium sp. USDA 4532]|uniref:FkbM family methyltransferase n=1 Tax=unclassified Bradyrhizobium TaxID=2631580 RepID=UPI00209FEAE0|nr:MULTISPECIES: FkbM family methyltransferase [unclassified Bradyrhizobium]MCP1831760.1 FkbM family methyltransferase [Bradyrhizobium sp. USDA 4545]MCP1916596.1 FkbM family methyltransferase [Bradyrhizobium sp. USDA 4532]